jgi:hypothetical protein
MKNYTITSVFLFMLTQFAIGQNTLFIGEKAYPCTTKATLLRDKGSSGHDLGVIIAKNGETAMLVLSTATISGGIGVRIKGNVLLYLEDGTVITCYDRGKFDILNNIATTIYYLTKEEIIKMQQSNINSIRFSLKCFECYKSSEEGNFLSSNQEETGFSFLKIEKSDFPSLISSLFNN